MLIPLVDGEDNLAQIEYIFSCQVTTKKTKRKIRWVFYSSSMDETQGHTHHHHHHTIYIYNNTHRALFSTIVSHCCNCRRHPTPDCYSLRPTIWSWKRIWKNACAFLEPNRIMIVVHHVVATDTNKSGSLHHSPIRRVPRFVNSGVGHCRYHRWYGPQCPYPTPVSWSW